jgi:hypothetical protein
LGFIGGRGHGKTQFGPYSDAAVVFRAEDNFTDVSHPAAITLETTPPNSTTRQERVRITAEGRVGIGLSNPSYQLHLSLDQAAKPSTSTWTISSDLRLKTILGPYTKGLPELMRLRPVRYRYLNPKDAVLFAPSVLEKENVGFIAQEVAMIFPEAVDTAANGYLSLNIHAILIAYLNAIQQLKAENDSLRTTITEMQKVIAEMQEKQAAFEKALAELSQNHKTPYTKSATPLIWRRKTSRFTASR